MSLRAYSNHFLMLHNHMGMVGPRAFHSGCRLIALDQIQLYAYCIVVKRRFSILCSDLNFPFCISRLFDRFSSGSFLCVTTPNYSRKTSYIIRLNDVICWSMGPLRWVVSKKESSWSKFVHVAIWLPFEHWILGFLGMSSRELRRLHQRTWWIRNPRKLLSSLPQSHVVGGNITKSFPFEQVWWVIFFLLATDTQRVYIYIYIFNNYFDSFHPHPLLLLVWFLSLMAHHS